ncbi:MAG: N-6 DNA methylase [Pseudomonadota bacterium]
MRGYVPTPEPVVDLMVDKLFAHRPPRSADRLLDPGCGPGAFIAGVLRGCARRGLAPPRILGVEEHAAFAAEARARFSGEPAVQIHHRDFLAGDPGQFEHVVGNPPYVPITGLSEAEKSSYRARFQTARGRFDLYLLFFEQALAALAPGGRLVFITPEKFLYVESARPLRRLLAQAGVEEVALLPEDVFAPLVTYPAVTTVQVDAVAGPGRLLRRDGGVLPLTLDPAGASLMPQIQGAPATAAPYGPVLEDLCLRVSAGVATGADSVFVRGQVSLPGPLCPFARPTLSGRQLAGQGRPLRPRDVMLLPYDPSGALLPEDQLGALGALLREPAIRARLEARTCARRKPWYAFHETPPLPDLLRPKLLCKDIAARPEFWADEQGDLVPRHSAYYVVPRDPALLGPLCAYLNSEPAARWLQAHCHRAANGFLRLQSSVLKRLPLPESLLPTLPAMASEPAA